MSIKVREISFEEIDLIVKILNHIPEFDSVFYKNKIVKTIENRDKVLLVAEFAGKPIACKIAYNRYFDGSIYSWLGGVLPPYRNQGIASALQGKLEEIAKKRFYASIRLKTRNMHVGMLVFALKNNFQIVGFKQNEDVNQSRIELLKNISDR